MEKALKNSRKIGWAHEFFNILTSEERKILIGEIKKIKVFNCKDWIPFLNKFLIATLEFTSMVIWFKTPVDRKAPSYVFIIHNVDLNCEVELKRDYREKLLSYKITKDKMDCEYECGEGIAAMKNIFMEILQIKSAKKKIL